MAAPKGTIPPNAGKGRPKGSKNKASAKKAAEIAASGQTPLDYMIGVMRDKEAGEALRLDAAKSAAPYVHPRLAAVEHSGAVGLTFEQWLEQLG